jgi:hypothetical protein
LTEKPIGSGLKCSARSSTHPELFVQLKNQSNG